MGTNMVLVTETTVAMQRSLPGHLQKHWWLLALPVGEAPAVDHKGCPMVGTK